MPFLVRGFDVSVLLHNSLPARDSLYSVLLEARPNLFAALRQHWDGSYARSTPMSGTGYRPAISAFSALEGWWGSGYGDGDLARAMFAGARAGDATNITGCANAQQFTAAFEAARDEAFYVFLQLSTVNELNSFSFKATYLHRDIEALFQRRAHSYVSQVLRHRVLETARIMFRILWGNMNGAWRLAYQKRTIVTTLLLGMMHNRMLRTPAYAVAGRQLYNQSSVAFTLLTFAYVPAMHWRAEQGARPRGFAFNEANWYYFWRIFGSLLGLDARMLPHDHFEAAQMWQDFFESGECRGNPQNLTTGQPGFNLLDPGLVGAYDQSVRLQPSTDTTLDLLSFFPAWLVTQLRSAGRWYHFLRGQ
ncbi:MAG: DUF2236 domain-containing protein [Myxococcales bacterium]|jgi:hypothetical protein|nr:DUF2236 domain-containing protein [Myxococcales bacterium]